MDKRDGWFPYIWDPHSLQWLLGVVMASILMFVGTFLLAYLPNTAILTIFLIVMVITWLVLGLVVHNYEKKKRTIGELLDTSGGIEEVEEDPE